MNRFIHVGFMFPRTPKTNVLEPVFSQMGDWVRYSNSSWIVWTNKDPNEIYNLLAPHLVKDENVLVAPLELSSYQGWMPNWIWDWIKSKPMAPLGMGPALNPLLTQSPLQILGGAFGQPPNPFLPKK